MYITSCSTSCMPTPQPTGLRGAGATLITRTNQTLIADKNCFGAEFEATVHETGITLLRPARRSEPARPARDADREARQGVRGRGVPLRRAAARSRRKRLTRYAIRLDGAETECVDHRPILRAHAPPDQSQRVPSPTAKSPRARQTAQVRGEHVGSSRKSPPNLCSRDCSARKIVARRPGQ